METSVDTESDVLELLIILVLGLRTGPGVSQALVFWPRIILIFQGQEVR